MTSRCARVRTRRPPLSGRPRRARVWPSIRSPCSRNSSGRAGSAWIRRAPMPRAASTRRRDGWPPPRRSSPRPRPRRRRPRARAQLEEARANRTDLRVIAPFNGTVATRTAEPGEVVMAGTAVITLVNLAEVYLRAFVPEGQIGRVSVGQPARVYLDSAPAKPIDAYVLRVDPQASFTPENTYFREDRVKQVVGVKLRLKGALGFAKPGMPADGEILVDGNDWPTRQAHR